MATGRELAEKVKARAEHLKKTGEINSKQGHVTPCAENFDYSAIGAGCKEGRQLILDEISSK